MEFQGFGKIARLDREIIITEKIDGTNAQVFIEDVPLTVYAERLKNNTLGRVYADDSFGPDGYVRLLRVGSRNRWISPEDDNFGFAEWAFGYAVNDLLALGPGRHFGEWWGRGIQRGYGVGERYFSLFNTSRWANEVPTGCKVVPVLYQGKFSQESIEGSLERLRNEGSVAAPGFMEPEGIVVYHTASNTLFKKTIGNDGPKGE